MSAGILGATNFSTYLLAPLQRKTIQEFQFDRPVVRALFFLPISDFLRILVVTGFGIKDIYYSISHEFLHPLVLRRPSLGGPPGHSCV